MIKIILNGCAGRMGRVISKIANQSEDITIVAGCDINPQDNGDYPVFNHISQCEITADLVIDFSHPSAFEDVLSFCVSNNLPIVMATTGLSQKQIDNLFDTSKKIPVFYSANMSMGINLLIQMAKTAACFTEGFFDIEIVEKHHNKKIDAPSGTALAIADEINSSLSRDKIPVYNRHMKREQRSENEIGIHAIRGGSIVGEHTVIFAGSDEIIEIKHEALSRDIFASGALRAAKFIKDKTPGFYSMENIIKG